MMLIGKVSKEANGWWSAECDVIGVFTQGTSRKDAKEMLADAIEAVVDIKGFEIAVVDGEGDGVLVVSDDSTALGAYVLRYQREVHGMSLSDVAHELGASSRNAYARYEQGVATPTMAKFIQLMNAVAPDVTVVVGSPKRRASR